MPKKGFVYVMSNLSMPGIIKVGMSTKIPDERAKELSSETSTPTPFIVEYYALFDDMQKAEKLAHQKLQKYHHGKEFFKTNAAQAINEIENLGLQFTKLHSKPENDRKARELQHQRDQAQVMELENRRKAAELKKRQEASLLEVRKFKEQVTQNSGQKKQELIRATKKKKEKELSYYFVKYGGIFFGIFFTIVGPIMVKGEYPTLAFWFGGAMIVGSLFFID